MRIIAGTKKGTRLKMVPGQHVRPTSDRVKESLFQITGPFFNGGRALDLFAGSGALGLEALSRGMEYVLFVDHSSKSIQTIYENIKILNMEDRAKYIRGDARKIIKELKKQGLVFSMIFLDPPYQKNLLIPVLQLLSDGQLLTSDGLVIAEYPSNYVLHPLYGNLQSIRKIDYGNTLVSLFQRNDVRGDNHLNEDSCISREF